MSAIYKPVINIDSAVKMSTPEQDGKNSGFSRYRITATIHFDVYDTSVEAAEDEARNKLEHALA